MKNLFLIFLAFSILPIMKLSVFAGSSSGSGPSTLYQENISCSDCDETAYLFSMKISEWIPVNYVECKDTPKYNNTVQERTVKKYYQCADCDFITKKEMFEHQVICDHP